MRPASESLIDYYKKFGFCEVDASNQNGEIEVEPDGGYKELCEKDKKGEYTAMYYGGELEGKLYFPYSLA